MLGEIGVLNETSSRVEIDATHFLGNEETATAEAERLPSLDDLVFSLAAAFRQHPHISNVLTHISSSNWGKVEQALRSILDPRAGSCDLSPLAQNIIRTHVCRPWRHRADHEAVFSPPVGRHPRTRSCCSVRPACHRSFPGARM